ncbi:hypothetical protein R3W88_012896 [Solanum pinnatisectum]|uniref:NADH dehydrogenase [ubiquinone] iron-sulfur protein 4, mitochondrial n=1 Tax=Solanum pinnatisectum TaxID=50273 RepID=A0AAV9LAY9_9SOLN|nr:hypothetical protein R3W88_012896 [Solanum pinnatisectum]
MSSSSSLSPSLSRQKKQMQILRNRAYHSQQLTGNYCHCLFTCKNCNSTRLWKGWKVGNPLIRWTSTGDPLSYTDEIGLSFDSVDTTNAFAEKHGWEYIV